MCNIAFVPKHEDISDETIRIIFRKNPDGAGVMWKPCEGAPIEIRKGFFDVNELIRVFRNIPKTCDRAIHCRIATTGIVNKNCCHPFPVRECTRSMKDKSTCTDVAIMHNGVLPISIPPKGAQSPYSDTMLFAKEILYPLKYALQSHYIQAVIEKSINSSRLLIFRQFGEPIMLGNWVKDGKLYFSNTSYKEFYDYSSYYSKPKIVSNTTSLPVGNNDVKKEEKSVEDQPDGYEYSQDELNKMMNIVLEKEMNGEFDTPDGELDLDLENDFINNYNPEDWSDWNGGTDV